MEKKNDLGLLLIRIIIGAPMILHGMNKVIYGISAIGDMLTNFGLPSFVAYGVYLGEVVAPILLVIGFRTRLAGLIMAINCTMIILLAHTADILRLNEYGGWAIELIAIYLVASLSLFFTGAGRYAISAKNKWD